MNSPHNAIRKVTLETGFLEKKDDRSKCVIITFEGDAIPQNVLETFEKDDYRSLRSNYGDPTWGHPIQYDRITIEDDQGTKEIEIFNRAILLLVNNTEETRRAHRVIYAVEKYKATKPSGILPPGKD